MRPLLPLYLLLLLACAGIPNPEEYPDPVLTPDATPAPAEPTPLAPLAPPAPPGPPAVAANGDPAWIAEAVAAALEWEVMPGTTGEPDDGTRAAALRTFFLAHPEYIDATLRERLASEACGLGTEGAHEWLTKPPPKTPAIVEVNTDAWEVFVAHSQYNCTSDDWSWYSSEASEAASARGAVTGYAGANNDVVVVQREGRELARIPVKEQGFLAARAGAEPKELGYSPTPELVPDLDAYFGAAK